MKKQDFLKEVKHEIDSLKENATKEELNNLDFSIFDPEYPNTCIYGQMAGTCANSRARELMDASCLRVVDIRKDGSDISIGLKNKTFSEIKNNINGKYTSQTWNGDNWRGRNFSYHSALEAYLYLKDSKNKQIIEYLKGERDTLKL